MPIELADAHDALRWTWIALAAWLVAVNIFVWLGSSTPIGGIAVLTGLALTWVAGRKSDRARHTARAPHA